MVLKKRSRSVSKPRRVALLIESSMMSGRQVLNGIAEYMHQAEPWSVYYEPGHFYFRNVLPNWLKRWRGDGILARIRTYEVAAMLARLRIPVVDLMSDLPKIRIPAVGLDHRKIAELAAKHLSESGFRRFAYCGLRGVQWSQRRYEYFGASVEELGYELHVNWLPTRNSRAWSSEAEYERLARWVADLPKPVGVMACNDVVGQRVLEACRQAGVMVPEQAAVVGVDNDEAFCRIADPMLSSIAPGHDRVGFHGAELLDRLMRGEAPPREALIVGFPHIVVRQSTDVQMVGDRDMALALRFIRERACSAVGVREVAAHVSLSYSTLNRRFHAFLSRSIHDEITRVRLNRVRELLLATQLTLPQIARLTGFAHHEYLGAIFKSEMGITPGQFRSKNANLSAS